MCRSALALAVLVAALAFGAAPADAALVPPNPVCIVSDCEEEKKDPEQSGRRSSCPLPAMVVCAGGSLIAVR